MANPAPRGLPTRRERSRPGQGVPLVRAVRRLPRILSPAQVDALMAALRTHRDRAMVAAMVLGGLRRCEVLGLRLEDLRVAERRVFIAEGKGGRQRLIPVSGRFFAAVAAYLDAERPPGTVPTGCSWCSRGRAAGSRCPPGGWRRSCPRRGAGPASSMRPAMSCGIPA
jgi:integrase/recombinase XerD